MIIDVVIPWVDGNDLVLNARRASWSGSGASEMPDVGGVTRYANDGELYWCVASINRFAPFVNCIYIVTDGQDPCLDCFLDLNFPDGHIPVKVIDHREIFDGYSQYLPVFNSLSIETMQWRIPGLAEHVLMFNDDILLCAPVSPEDFFLPDGRAVCYADTFSLRRARLLRILKNLFHGRRVVTFKNTMINACELAGEKESFLYLRHVPRAQFTSDYREYFTSHPEQLEQNLKYRFRNPAQFNPQEIVTLKMRREGRLFLIPARKYDFFLQPKGTEKYFDAKMEKLRRGAYRFCCFNSLDQASERNKEQVRDYVKKILDLK